MLRVVHNLFSVGIFILPLAACKGTWSSEECTIRGSEDCNSCVSVGENDYATCDISADEYDPESTLKENPHANTCSDGGELLTAYKQGWLNRGCTEYGKQNKATLRASSTTLFDESRRLIGENK